MDEVFGERYENIEAQHCMMTFWIDNLADQAADPTEAGRKMRQCYYTLEKLTKRQLTVDCLKKLRVRRVGTNEVEKMSKRMIRG